MQDSKGYLTATDVLEDIKTRLQEKSQDDMSVLLKIFHDLKSLDAYRMSPHDASRWLIQPQTKKEKRFEGFVTRYGFDRGFTRGFLAGFGVCALFSLVTKFG